jgi:hypothetical protein
MQVRDVASNCCYNQPMTILVDDISALEYYLHHPVTPVMLDRAQLVVQRGMSPASRPELEAFLQRSLDIDCETLHLATLDANNRPLKHRFRYRTVSRSALANSAALPTDDALLVSPEAALVSVATKCDFVSLVELGSLLCSCFYLREDREFGIAQRQVPLASPKSISSFISKNPNLPGAVLTKRCLGQIVANAESPMEVKVAMLMCLPRRYGGGALPLPELGFSVTIPDCYWKTSSMGAFRYDFFWPDCNLEVEYDSDAVHATSEKLFRDARRRNIIQALGVTSLSLTRGQVMHEAVFEEFIREVYSMQNIRYRIPTAQHHVAQRELRARLFDAGRREEVLRDLRR